MSTIKLKTAKRASTSVKRSEVRKAISRAFNGHVVTKASRASNARPKTRAAAKRT